jgi:hypothetical protein
MKFINESQINLYVYYKYDHFCGLVARVPAYRSRGLGSTPSGYQIFWEVVSLERGPLSLLSTSEELLGRNSSGFGPENREYGLGPHSSPTTFRNFLASHTS